MTDEHCDTFPNLFFRNHEQVLQIARDEPQTLDDLAAADNQATSGDEAIFPDPNALCIAVLDAQSRIVAQTPSFTSDGLVSQLDPHQAERAVLLGRAVFDGRGGASAMLCYVPSARLSAWNWDPAIAGAIASGHPVTVFAERLHKPGAIARACASFSLSPGQTRVVHETIRTGSIRMAAANVGLSYQRTRAIISEALALAGCSSIVELITLIAVQSFGISVKSDVSPDRLLVETWGVTGRQARLAVLITEGQSRAASARLLGLSEATVKKDMAALYQSLGVASAPELAARLGVLRLHSHLAEAKVIRGDFADLGADPLRFCQARDGRRIAYSDYGPRDGFPLFYVHSSMTSRLLPRSLLAALLEQGFRVIAIDRPGFGLTSPTDGPQFDVAAHDFRRVQEHLGLGPALAISRGGAQFLLALARIYPASLAGAVVTNPDPRTGASELRQGPLGAAKEYFRKSPHMISTAIRLAVRLVSPSLLETWIRKAVSGSPADESIVESDPSVVADYWRGIRAFTAGGFHGYVAEQIEMATGQDEALDKASWPWEIFVGAQDTLHDARQAARHWNSLIPDARVHEIADAGRLLSFTHRAHIVAALGRMRCSCRADRPALTGHFTYQ